LNRQYIITAMTRKNSFDFIRLLAAVAVIFSHSFALTGHSEPGAGTISIGAISVWIFFILSGYLISKSWDQYPRFNVFFAKRILRIFPGLVVAVLSTIAVAGLFFTSLPLFTYLFHQETFTYLNNIFLYNSSFTLPGVFNTNIYPNAVNGSIWTLAYEFTMYLVVAIIGALRIYKKIPPIAFWGTLFGLVLLMAIIGREYFSLSLFYLTIGQMIIFALMFFSGILMHKYEKRIKLNTWLGFTGLAAFVILSLLLPDYTALFGATLLAYGIFAVGRHGHMSWTSKYGDFSYGLYIYAFPIQQMIASITHTANPLKMFALSFILTLIASILSWHFVESRALKWKDKIDTKKYPLLQSDEAW